MIWKYSVTYLNWNALGPQFETITQEFTLQMVYH